MLSPLSAPKKKRSTLFGTARRTQKPTALRRPCGEVVEALRRLVTRTPIIFVPSRGLRRPDQHPRATMKLRSARAAALLFGLGLLAFASAAAPSNLFDDEGGEGRPALKGGERGKGKGQADGAAKGGNKGDGKKGGKKKGKGKKKKKSDDDEKVSAAKAAMEDMFVHGRAQQEVW